MVVPRKTRQARAKLEMTATVNEVGAKQVVFVHALIDREFTAPILCAHPLRPQGIAEDVASHPMTDNPGSLTQPVET